MGLNESYFSINRFGVDKKLLGVILVTVNKVTWLLIWSNKAVVSTLAWHLFLAKKDA